MIDWGTEKPDQHWATAVNFRYPPVEDTICGGENIIGNPAYHSKWYQKSEQKFINCFGKSVKIS